MKKINRNKGIAKTLISGFCIMFISVFAHAQSDIIIDFVGTGASSSVATVELINLSNCDSITVSGDSSINLSTDITFNAGDIIKLKGISGNYSTIITDNPTVSTTYTFEFIPCTDYDGNNYSVVKIGNQWWMAENLRSEHYSNGTVITEAYDDGSVYLANYGRLYTWNATMNGEASSNLNPSGVQGIAPTDWHVPSDIEWTELTDYLGGQAVSGEKIKSICSILWAQPNIANNESGFTFLPGGGYSGGSFNNVGNSGHGWSTTEDNSTEAWLLGSNYAYAGVGRYVGDKVNGMSIRCIANSGSTGTDNINTPLNFNLKQNYPNPFNSTTTINYQLPKSTSVNISIYDIRGQLVETLVNEQNNSGSHSVVWNAENVKQGIYYYKIVTDKFIETKKCLLLK